MEDTFLDHSNLLPGHHSVSGVVRAPSTNTPTLGVGQDSIQESSPQTAGERVVVFRHHTTEQNLPPVTLELGLAFIFGDFHHRAPLVLDRFLAKKASLDKHRVPQASERGGGNLVKIIKLAIGTPSFIHLGPSETGFEFPSSLHGLDRSGDSVRQQGRGIVKVVDYISRGHNISRLLTGKVPLHEIGNLPPRT